MWTVSMACLPNDSGSNANSDSHVDLYPDDFRFVRKSKYVDEEREENSKKLKENSSSILKKLMSSYCQQLRIQTQFPVSQDIYIRIAASELDSPGKSDGKTGNMSY
ncbi:uncharacterized protein LOC132623760 [Lycium barbarum]|uniref:uncharacterized protein LOC132623760 n=1 Tax=Lycium barbarum TaxID=112863 RepID=UPI00293E8380|nr:uncharacterized protein LOC132623760 [Lycium barbarum]